MNKIDKIFQNKLADHSAPPPAFAWEKLQAEMNTGKKQVLPWKLGIAASLTLFLSAGIIIYNMNKPVIVDPHELNQAGGIAITEPVKPDEKFHTPYTENKNQGNEIRSNESFTHKADADKRVPSGKNLQNTFTEETHFKEVPILPIEPQGLQIEMSPQFAKNEDDRFNLPDGQQNRSAGYVIEIIYKPSVAKADEEPKIITASSMEEENEQSKIQKVLSIAGDLKGDLGLAKLREAKEDILAFDLSFNRKNKNQPK